MDKKIRKYTVDEGWNTQIPQPIKLGDPQKNDKKCHHYGRTN